MFLELCAKRVYVNSSVDSTDATLNKLKPEDIIHLLNSLDHETLSHRMFLGCFSEAVKSGKIRGLKKTSLFRSTLAYFLLVPSARENLLRELAAAKKQIAA